jgi:hypothetical protein
MNCIKCGSFAINEGSYDRVRGGDSNLCDVHYWMKRASELEAALAAATARRDLDMVNLMTLGAAYTDRHGDYAIDAAINGEQAA